MDTLLHWYDCNNTLIFFDQFVYTDENVLIKVSEEQSTNIVRSVKEPGMMMETNQGCRMRYYLKEIDRNKTILIGVKYENGIWKVREYFENSSAFICP